MNVAWILVPVFAAVGVWLLVYTARRRRMLRAFAAEHGLRHRPVDDGGGLEETLDRSFALPRPFVRTFSRVRDVVEDDGVRLFRCTELLDLDRHGGADASHAGRIAALVDFPGAPDGTEAFFLVRRGGVPEPVVESVHGDPRADPALADLREALARHPAPHTLSVSLGGGKLLLHLEPLVTGSEKPADLAYLRSLARDLRDVRASRASVSGQTGRQGGSR